MSFQTQADGGSLADPVAFQAHERDNRPKEIVKDACRSVLSASDNVYAKYDIIYVRPEDALSAAAEIRRRHAA